MSTELEALVSNEKLEKAFMGTNFGTMTHRDVVKYALLKYASIYRTGHTAMSILIDLGLISAKTHKLTRLGKIYLYDAFYQGVSL